MTICDQCESKDGRATFCKTILDLDYDLCMECIEYVKTELEGLKGGRPRTGPIYPTWLDPLYSPSLPYIVESIPCGTGVTVRGTPYEFETTAEHPKYKTCICDGTYHTLPI